MSITKDIKSKVIADFCRPTVDTPWMSHIDFECSKVHPTRFFPHSPSVVCAQRRKMWAAVTQWRALLLSKRWLFYSSEILCSTYILEDRDEHENAPLQDRQGK